MSDQQIINKDDKVWIQLFTGCVPGVATSYPAFDPISDRFVVLCMYQLNGKVYNDPIPAEDVFPRVSVGDT